LHRMHGLRAGIDMRQGYYGILMGRTGILAHVFGVAWVM
jgi:hypothetical protein